MTTPEPGIVIVGAGQAGVQAAESLRDAGFTGPLTLIGDEPELPYQRPPLSKEYLAGKLSGEELTLRADRFYADREIELIVGRRVVGLDRARRKVTLDDHTELPYAHLVLATGSRPRPLPLPGSGLAGVFDLRTRADAEELRRRLGEARDVVVIGAGFIGLEFAAACRAAGLSPVVLDIADQVMGRAVSVSTAVHFAEQHRLGGTRLLMGTAPTELIGRDGRVTGVRTADGTTVPADLVVTGIGVLPNAELAGLAGLETDNGIVVDAHLATADPHISAIGDCAAFPDPHGSGRRIRLESVQNAADQARCLAARLTGTPRPYDALPWFWSYQGDLRLQIAGLSTGHDHTCVHTDERGNGFSVFCFRDGALVAVESVNRPADHMAARRVLAAGLTVTPEDVAEPGFSLRSHLARATVSDRRTSA
ncbi:NAD(P)/FAD-dependent oxidoreductase [Streptomyces ipomoeae]|uniref:NAD(P)/FAD-dependent oxidoreductase n=1 Tax=Streptomyces ipomoeae TaxID=103232 RepID=UPI001146AF82|nr:FAD-dependent oxidoreductase [Streptomyces ipomoeae]MDX2937386.1 FAD-dependent oxidoreductase [Streptomyces ipomoeae]TQE15942.1 pyridine nucleotide-disulfide oxidoreductase [Streptomyces ipomoeae]